VARAALRDHDRSGVEAALDAIAHPTRRDQIEALVLRAQVTPRPDSLAMVRDAAAVAVGAGLFHTFLREGAEVLRLARSALHERPTPPLAALLERAPATRSPVRDTLYTEPLAARELALLQLLPTHLTYGEIADEMCVSINTVKTYQKALFRKLHAAKRSEAVAAARQAGLLDALV
jgi:DNA-binding CsgD family transcriptional regulator